MGESKADPKLASPSKGWRPSAFPSLEFSGGAVVVAEAVVDDGAGPAGPSRGEDPLRDRWCCGMALRCRVAVAVAGSLAASRGWSPRRPGESLLYPRGKPDPSPRERGPWSAVPPHINQGLAGEATVW